MPGHVLGINLIRAGSGFILDAWRSLASPRCPACAASVLVIDEAGDMDLSADGSQVLFPWRCCNAECGHVLLAPYSLSKARQLVRSQQAIFAKQAFEHLDTSAIAGLIRSHVRISRLSYLGGLLCLLGAAYYAAKTNVSTIIVVDWLVIGLAVGLRGMLRAYRACQLRERQLFVRGAFWQWLRRGPWIV